MFRSGRLVANYDETFVYPGRLTIDSGGERMRSHP
jgi:hypothetical protein